MDLLQFKQTAQSRSENNKKFLRKLKQAHGGKVDQAFAHNHEAVFQKTDCLDCANCCKTTSPIFINADIDRLARSFNIKPGAFIDQHLRMDEDGDYVLKTSPCPFLQADNKCGVYEDRPRACREYPHTNRKKMFQILDLTYQNTLVCPAVLEIVERINSEWT